MNSIKLKAQAKKQKYYNKNQEISSDESDGELTSEDEEKAFQLIKRKRELLLPLLEKYSGKLVKEIGDGTLTRYYNTKDAIDCANSFQARTDNKLRVRAGIQKLNNKTLIINQIPFGTTTDSLIDSIVRATEKNKIKIKKIEDNTSLLQKLLFTYLMGFHPIK